MAPREEFNLVEERIITGRGVLQIPTLLSYRYFRIWIDVFRDPDPNAVNKKYNPERSDYVNVSFMAGNYVVKSHVIRYQQEVLDLPAKEPGAFLAPYLVCSLQGIGNFLAAISVAVGLPPPVPGDPLYAEPVRSPVDSILFVCRDSTAIQVRLFGLLEDVGCIGATPNPKINEPPATSEPDIPPGDPVTVSPAYVPPDDDGNTVPFSGDGPPTTFNCEFTYDYVDNNDPSFNGTYPKTVSGVVPPISFGPPIYSDFGGIPDGGPRDSAVEITDANGFTQTVVVVNNTFSSHSISNLTQTTCTPA